MEKKKKVVEKEWKEKKSRKQFVNKEIDLLKDRFYLQGWTFSTDHFKFPNQQNEGVAAEVNTDYKYRRIILRIYPPFWAENEEERKNILLHEMCHVLTEPIFDLLMRSQKGMIVLEDEKDRVNEHVTCWIQNIIQRVDT
jgi:hypothetical protein